MGNGPIFFEAKLFMVLSGTRLRDTLVSIRNTSTDRPPNNTDLIKTRGDVGSGLAEMSDLYLPVEPK